MDGQTYTKNCAAYYSVWIKRNYRGERSLRRDDGQVFTTSSSNTQSTFTNYCSNTFWQDRKIIGTSYKVYMDNNTHPFKVPSGLKNNPATTSNGSWDASAGW